MKTFNNPFDENEQPPLQQPSWATTVLVASGFVAIVIFLYCLYVLASGS